MADMGAIERAAQGPEMAPPPEMGAEASQGVEVLAQGMEAINAFLNVQMQEGNPAAQGAMAAFQQLVESMKSMVNPEQEAPIAEAPIEQAPQEQGQVPLEKGVVV